MKTQHSTKSVERPTSTTEIVTAAAQLADEGRADQALHLIVSSKSLSPEITNARGVCLMRLGQINDAVQVYRPLVH